MSEQLSKFQIYWRDLKQNHPDVYEARLKRNSDRIRAKRHQIYKDPKKHEAFKAKNRIYYQKRRDRLKAKAIESKNKNE